MSQNPTLTQPIDYRTPVTPEEASLSAEGLQNVQRIFDEMITENLHPGAQLVVLRDGRPVLNLAAGVADLRRGRLVTPDTPYLVFSCTKPFTAACIHLLAQRGQLDYDTPIADYWPEFGCKGKESATVRHALLHQAGIPWRGMLAQLPLWPFWRLVTRSVARLPAEFPPGTQTAYHTVNFGWILGEVVRRVSGQPVHLFLEENFLAPLGMRHTSMKLTPALRAEAAGVYWGHVQQRAAARAFNIPALRGAVIPAASLHSTACDLAVFYQMLINGGQYAGRQFLAPQTVQAATALQYEGYDNTIRHTIRWAMGFSLGGISPDAEAGAHIFGEGSSVRTFGHPGQGTCVTWADPDARLVVAFTCNRLQESRITRQRWKSLGDAIWGCL